ncbi:MAG: hypothetical protein GWO16_11375 [Gammaproteobacteria bacterium]|nr:hypothetical protein [Gammaproteobacteria bacterium]NIR31079.1 hypothetical protein [Gammaproteobacteria bacterium]NIR98534.1 hypothetical protein [Gammaproteobacteria bacterium]NIT64256.1 hypothetical protein [Gammaproteobacteria bacterium]NIV21861.1 hypothetical protein [Gammaproteobacteria bacterium]
MDKRLVALAVAAVFGTAAVAAGGGAGKGEMGAQAGSPEETQARFQEIDANQDGYISMQEAEEHQRLKDHWTAADQNADGQVDEAEFSAFEEQYPAGESE